jgi:hypothetical protein
MIEVDLQYKELIELLCKAIMQRTLLKIYYKSDKRSDWRIIRPYMIWQNPKENLSLAGVPIEELQKPSIEKRNSGQYLLPQLITRLKAGQIQILPENFEELGIPRKRVDDTQTKDVICRFIYDDENKKEVKKQWIKVKYVQ